MNGPRKSATKSQIINFKLLDMLPTMTPDEQLEVFEKVIQSSNPAVRPRALGLGAAILSNSRLLEYLRQEDDVRRNAAVEILKLRRQRSLNLACYLLEDKDPDVVLQAVLILSHLHDRQSVEALVKVLEHEDPNVVQEALVALGKIGDVRALPAVKRFLRGEPWVQVAAIETIGRIGSPAVIPELVELLDEPLLAQLVTDALARIGGAQAVEALSLHWLSKPDELRSEVNLRRMAEMLESLTSAPPDIAGLEEALEEQVRCGDKELRIQAVRCLVALRGSNRGLWMF
ncbi:MAG: HEAT repeat domain-containing protein [Acidobacteriota bacterium]